MRKILSVISLLFLLLTAGCIMEEKPCEGNGGGNAGDSPYTLTFTVGVPAMDSGASTRAIYYGNPLYYEDWIDTQDGLRVLFFISKREKTGSSYVAGAYGDEDTRAASDPKNPLKDYFLFESTSRWVTQLPYDDNNNLRYRITVPVYQIGDEESEYRDHWERIRELLREYDFKVAILANHKSPDNTSKFTWTIKNSVLSAADIDDLSGEKNIRTINDIHHTVEDNLYTDGGTGRKEGYDMLIDKTTKTMGPFIDWVTARSELYGDALGGTFNTRETARTWIRDYWIPDLIYNEDTDPDIDYQTLYHNYRHIWSYWNFGGAAPDNALPYSTKSKINKHLGDWEVRNGKLLREWVTNAWYNNDGTLTELSTASTGKEKYDGTMGLTFHPSAAKAVITESNGKRLYGVKLPKLSSDPSNTSAKDCFLFTINSAGTVTVRYSGSENAITIKGANTTTASKATSQTINGVKVYEFQVSYETVTSTLNGYIYSKNNEAIIYDIEYTQDEYMYGSDREGILPSSDHPIPMYGVQQYDKLRGYWEEGSSFDLTEGGTDESGMSYHARTISLLRAVAKIEVLIPKSLGVPKHIYMRSFNRRVRCEPMDVATPTEKLWKDHNNGCEWKMVQARGPMMGSGGSYTTTDYKTKLAWFYGNWLEWGWNFNNQTSVAPKYEQGPFPRLYNPYINRADRAAFIDVTDYYNDQYYHYLFYMGENTLDAPSTYSGGGSPTLPHVEIRFDERYAATSKVAPNSDLNLMDNDCYRIYFTDGGLAAGARNADGTSKIPYDKYIDQYEKKPEYVKEHWPVIRNHVYSFTVLDNGSDKMNGLVVNVQNRSTDFDFH